jgi:RNA binding exosome subunit
MLEWFRSLTTPQRHADKQAATAEAINAQTAQDLKDLRCKINSFQHLLDEVAKQRRGAQHD